MSFMCPKCGKSAVNCGCVTERRYSRAEVEALLEKQRTACAEAVRSKRLKRKEDIALAVFLESVVRNLPLVEPPP